MYIVLSVANYGTQVNIQYRQGMYVLTANGKWTEV